MKTTLELPDDLFRAAKVAAAADGVSLKDLMTEALREKLTKAASRRQRTNTPPWMKFFGAFGKSSQSRKETKRIQRRIDQEFGQIDPLE
jgi:hypothetical protein